MSDPWDDMYNMYDSINLEARVNFIRPGVYINEIVAAVDTIPGHP